MISRREFIRDVISGVLYVALDTTETDFLVGDSMALLWKRPRTKTIAGPTWTIKGIERTCSRFVDRATQEFGNAIIFAGTADCFYPPGEDYKSKRKSGHSPGEMSGILNNQEKCEQVCSDMEDLVNTVSGLDIKNLVIISPFPSIHMDNFRLIEMVDEELTSKHTGYARLNRKFYDFADKRFTDRSMFADMVHLNEKGYEYLEQCLIEDHKII